MLLCESDRVPGRGSDPDWVSSNGAFHLPIGCSTAILSITSACLVAGVAAFAAWRVTGNDAWIVQFFRIPAALVMVWMAGVAFWLCLKVVSHYEASEPMRTAWYFIAIS